MCGNSAQFRATYPQCRRRGGRFTPRCAVEQDFVVQHDAAAGGCHEAGDGIQDDRLAGAGRAEQCRDSGRGLEFDIHAVSLPGAPGSCRHLPAAHAISRIKDSQAHPGGNQHQPRLAGIAGQHGRREKIRKSAHEAYQNSPQQGSPLRAAA